MKEFLTVSKTSSDRMLDAPAVFCSQLTDGDEVFVQSVKQKWFWNASFPIANPTDNISSCRPSSWTGNGAFVRSSEPAVGVMSQFDWYIDPSNSSAHDENDGSALSPLVTDAERRRRMGSLPQWLDGAYHIRALSDSDGVMLTGEPHPSAVSTISIVVHGGLTTGVSPKAPLYSGLADTVAASTTGDMTKPPYLVTSNGLPTGWTESGLVGKRVRRTSDGAKFWVMFDVAGGSKQARCTETMSAGQFDTAPFTFPFSTSPALTNGNAIVVESLVQLRLLHIGLNRRQVGFIVVVENLKVGRRDSIAGSTTLFTNASVQFDGCEVWEFSGFSQGSITATGCLFTSAGTQISFPFCNTGTISACGFLKRLATNGSIGGLTVRNKTYFQGASVQLTVSNQNTLIVTSVAFFDTADIAIEALQGSFLRLGNGGGTAWRIWGNNATHVVRLTGGSNCTAEHVFSSMSGSVSDLNLNGKTTAFPFDTSTQTYLEARSLSFANWAASVATTGFGFKIFDPEMGMRFGDNGNE